MARDIGHGLLVVWDYDFSLVDINSDVWVPERCGGSELLEHMRASHRAGVQWTDLMDDVAARLHASSVSRAAIVETLRSMPVFPEVLSVIQELHAAGVQQLIVSDANEVYIRDFLAGHGVEHVFEGVVTNGGTWGEDGKLHISRYHPRDAPPHGCALCPVNMCKGAIVRARLAAAASPRPRVLYIGDGSGDVCPCLVLAQGDTVCARAGYPLAEALASRAEGVLANVVLWADGKELAGAIRAAHEAGTAGGGAGGQGSG